MSDAPSHRTNNFDCIRLVAATAVIFSHSYQLTGQDAHEPLMARSQGGYSIGHLAVDCFFILSGYLITQSWLQSKSRRDYFLKRALRIYPGFIAVILFCGLVVGPLAVDSSRTYWAAFDWGRFLRRMPLLLAPATPPVFAHVPHPDHLNGSLWSIPYEAVCYFMLPLLAWWGCLKNARGLLAATLAFYFTTVLDGHFHFLPDNSFLSPSIMAVQATFFLGGASIYLWRGKIKWSGGVAAVLLAILIGALAAQHFAWATPLCLPYLLVWFATNPRIRLHHAAKYGDFSYGVYLYAYPLQQLIVMWSGSQITPWGLFALALPTTLLFAFLSWHLVEAPALRLKRRL